MSWFGGGGGGSKAKKTASVSLMEFLRRPEYLGDLQEYATKYNEELQSNPFVQKLAKCTELQRHLEQCLQSHSPSDPKCLLLHQSWLLCAAKEVTPVEHKAFVDCATRHKEQPQLCEGDFQRMFKALTKMEQNAQHVKFSDVEEEGLLDCRVLLEKYQKLGAGESPAHDEAWEAWVQCVLPKACPADWTRFQACTANGKPLESCIEEGRPLFRCATDFTMRMMRSKGQGWN